MARLPSRSPVRPLAVALLAALPTLACLSAVARAQAATPSTLVIESARYGAYVGSAMPVRARWQPGAGAAPELVDTLVAWSSSDPLAAWVGLDGQVYFDRPGRVTITASRAGVVASRAFDVVAPRADSLTIRTSTVGATDASLRADDALTLDARLWSGERERVRDARLAYGIGIRGRDARGAAIDTAGRFTATTSGGYTLIAALGPLAASTVVPVTAAGGPGALVTARLARHADRNDGVREVRIEMPDEYAPYVGTSIPLRAAVVHTDGRAARVEWSSDDPATAWIDGDGVVHFLRRGSVQVAATAGGHRATRAFEVREPEAYRVLLRAPDRTATAIVGDSIRLEAEAWVIGGARLQHARLEMAVWTADGTAAAPRVTITEDGTFVAASPGTYTVLTAIAGHASSVVITVAPAPR